jgi:hypothetical protein
MTEGGSEAPNDMMYSSVSWLSEEEEEEDGGKESDGECESGGEDDGEGDGEASTFISSLMIQLKN